SYPTRRSSDLAVHLRGQLIRDEGRRLVELVPGLRYAEGPLELRLERLLQLWIAEDVLAVVEVPDIAGGEEAPRLAFVFREGAVERVQVVEGRADLVLGDEVVDRHDHPAVGEVRDPGRRRVDDVEPAGLGAVLGD